MEERRIPTQKPISDTITISVAEYYFLTKTATLLEAIMSAKSYNVEAVVEAVRTVLDSMAIRAEESAAE
jgi:hypothetical protein